MPKPVIALVGEEMDPTETSDSSFDDDDDDDCHGDTVPTRL